MLRPSQASVPNGRRCRSPSAISPAGCRRGRAALPTSHVQRRPQQGARGGCRIRDERPLREQAVQQVAGERPRAQAASCGGGPDFRQVIEAPAQLCSRRNAATAAGRSVHAPRRRGATSPLSQAAFRRSCQEITGASGRPSSAFQQARLERCTANPAADQRATGTSSASSASAVVTLATISSASCSTWPSALFWVAIVTSAAPASAPSAP